MTSSFDSNPEDEYADDEYADHDAEDRGQPSTPAGIPDEEPEEDVLEQRQEVPYREDDRLQAGGLAVPAVRLQAGVPRHLLRR
jgi:hypothetical protein